MIPDGTDSTALAQLLAALAAPRLESPAWADILDHADDMLGPAVAALIVWNLNCLDPMTGRLADLIDVRSLCDGMTHQLSVRVPCPTGGCPGPAWEPITEPGHLGALVDGRPPEDPTCERCHPWA